MIIWQPRLLYQMLEKALQLSDSHAGALFFISCWWFLLQMNEFEALTFYMYSYVQGYDEN